MHSLLRFDKIFAAKASEAGSFGSQETYNPFYVPDLGPFRVLWRL
jgi:hypothetical protein